MHPQSTVPSGRLTLTCEHCGAAFTRKACEVRRHGGRFCSKPCFHAARTRDPVERFLDLVLFEPNTGCWFWLGNVWGGYGQFRPQKRRPVYAHRYAYELYRGPIPAGLELDHLCHQPLCVNYAHLEPVTHRENIRRGRSPVVRRMDLTHCFQGHPFDAENTLYHPDGSRGCRRCRREYDQRRYAALKGRAG